jgi:hypothetical protein
MAAVLALEGVMTFPGTIHGLRAEKRLKAQGVACKLIPTPRELSSTCALALAFGREDSARVAETMTVGALRHDGIWIYPTDGGAPAPW